MKAIIKQTEELKAFKPFTIEITCETVEDARLMFHITNCGSLLKAIDSLEGYSLKCYHPNARGSVGGNLYSDIKYLIQSQGFEV